MQGNIMYKYYILLILLSHNSFSAIDVFPKILEIKQETGYLSIVNKGKKNEYISVEIFKITNPGNDYTKENHINVKHDEDPSIIYSPFKLVLRPNQTKKIKIKTIKTIKTEEVYRVNIKPIVNASLNFSSGIVINIGFSTIVFVYPNNREKKFTFTCGRKYDTAKNLGNTHVSAYSIDIKNKSEIRKIYPNQEISFNHGSVLINGEKCTSQE